MIAAHHFAILAKFPGVPLEWKTWFCIEPSSLAWFCIEPSSLAYVQDTVHIVKLKSKLLKPSGLLPNGWVHVYVAGIQHLRVLQLSFGKDEHVIKGKRY